jgi:hypothetical protein
MEYKYLFLYQKLFKNKGNFSDFRNFNTFLRINQVSTIDEFYKKAQQLKHPDDMEFWSAQRVMQYAPTQMSIKPRQFP